MEGNRLEFLILGPLEVRVGERALPLEGAKKLRRLLALLILRANENVPSDVLIEELWGGRPPKTAANTLQVYISRLRKLLPPGTLQTGHHGYLLRAKPGQIDLGRFERLLADGRKALAEGDPARATSELRNALGLWRGAALGELGLESRLGAEQRRLEELRMVALEERIEADLALNRHAELVGELRALVSQEPLRERLRLHLMLAFYRSGRQAEALELYRETRRLLVEELGIEPGPALQEIAKAILRHDPKLAGSPDVARGTARPTGRLPAPLTPILGREKELATLIGLAQRADVRLLTLTGAPGIGKTRLALELLRELEQDLHEDAVFVSLAPINDPALVAPTIARALGVHRQGREPVEETLERHLSDSAQLVLLDNFEQVLEAAVLLTRLLVRAPRLKIVVTSRAVLHVSGEHEFRVPPLGTGSSVRLFVERAQALEHDLAVDGDTRRAITEICEHLEGLPLAIELAAARTKLLPPAAMLARLGSRLGLLTGGAHDSPEHQRTLRATIDWSYRLLDDDEQKLFDALAVFAGGCSLEAVEAVADESENAILQWLGSLVDKSLLRQEGGEEPRFSMLETLREYALERLAVRGEERTFRHRHLNYFLALAEQAEPELHGPNQIDALRRLERELGNARAAIEFALQVDEGEKALRLATALRRLWQVHAHFGEGRRCLSAALEGGRGAPALLRAGGLNAAGMLAAEQGDYEDARQLFEASLQLAHEAGEPRRVASALGNLGSIAVSSEDYVRARELYEESIRVRRRSGDLFGIEIVLENLGIVAFCQGDLEHAVELFEESLAFAHKHGETQYASNALRSLARTLLVQGELGRASRLLEESLTLSRELGAKHGIADCLEMFGALAGAHGEPRRAAEFFGAADGLRDEIGALRAQEQQEWYRRVQASVREKLDAEAYERAYQRGRSISNDEALELAGAPGAAA